jgi:hypothetical protein
VGVDKTTTKMSLAVAHFISLPKQHSLVYKGVGELSG